jgi:hypothetical protein
MEGSGRARALIALAIACAVVLGVSWLAGRLDLGLAFTVGTCVSVAVALASTAAAPAIRLTAATSEPADGWGEFHRELTRARRFDRPVGIVRFVGVGRAGMTEGRVRDKTAALARRIDRLWLDGGDLFLLLPESDGPAVETAVARARYRIGESLDDCVTALFPANGITSGSLIGSLYQGDASPVAIGALSPVSPALAGPPSSDEDELAETAT